MTKINITITIIIKLIVINILIQLHHDNNQLILKLIKIQQYHHNNHQFIRKN